MNWKTINIEALPIAYDKLVQNRPNSINLNIGLSNNNMVKQFVNYKEPTLGFMWGNGSFTHLPAHKRTLERVCGNNNFQVIDVKCDTYEHLMQTLNLEKLDLFVLDVEGHEFEVIDGMIQATLFPDVFVIEHGHKTSNDIVEKLNVLPVKYKLDHVSFVNSFFIKI
jgi:FkbM family methyltransferase